MLQRVAAANRYCRPLRLALVPGSPGKQHSSAAAGLTAEAGAGTEQPIMLQSSGSASIRSRSSGSAVLKGSRQPGKLPAVRSLASPEVPLLPGGTAVAADGNRWEEERQEGKGEEGEQEQQQQQQHSEAEPLRQHRGASQQRSPSPWRLQHADGSAAVPHAASVMSPRQRLRRLGRTMAADFSVVFSQRLRRTTLLLYCIWFSNAISYYGLVLLTTALQTASKKHACTPTGAPNLRARDFVVRGRRGFGCGRGGWGEVGCGAVGWDGVGRSIFHRLELSEHVVLPFWQPHFAKHRRATGSSCGASACSPCCIELHWHPMLSWQRPAQACAAFQGTACTHFCLSISAPCVAP